MWGRALLFVPRATLTDAWLLLGPKMASQHNPVALHNKPLPLGWSCLRGTGPRSCANAAVAGLHLPACPIWLQGCGWRRLFLGRCCGAIQFPTRLSGYTPGSACLQIRSQKWQDFLLADHEADLQSKHVVEQALPHIPGAVELIHGCLQWDPDQRWTAARALQSPLFSGLPQIPQ